jgi:hypothetical protein
VITTFLSYPLRKYILDVKQNPTKSSTFLKKQNHHVHDLNEQKSQKDLGRPAVHSGLKREEKGQKGQKGLKNTKNS